ncbi:MAG: flippase-like domain-containing protein [Actinobacteria bacterium]|nr:flippase-like domain-containing protein [Actinomycetota bacterium]
MPRREPEDIDPLEIEAELDDESGGDDQVEAALERVRRAVFSRRAVAFAAVFVVVILAFLYGVVPQLPGLQDSLSKVKNDGDRSWLAVAFALELLSYAAYIWLFRAVFIRKVPRVGWAGSYQISLAGVAASRLFGAGGAGGIALTFWAVRKAGMGRRLSVSYLVAFFVVLYGVFMIALLATGVMLRTGAVPGNDPFAVTVIPALFAGIVIAIFLLMLLVPGNIERLAERWSHGRGRLAAVGQRMITAPALIGHGTRVAVRLIRERDVGLLGAVGWWAFDIATLWACFKAFGDSPPVAVVIMGYCVGMIANVIPTPGGVGAVEGGMIGAYAAFGVPLSLATAAVLAYRFFAFILPTIPGLFAFLRLRRKVARWQEEDATIQSKVLPA